MGSGDHFIFCSDLECGERVQDWWMHMQIQPWTCWIGVRVANFPACYPLFWEPSYVKHRLVKYKNELSKYKGIACINITFAHFHPRMAHWGELYGLSQKCQSALSGRSRSSDTYGRLGGSISPVRGWEMLWQRPVAQRTSGNGVRNGANCQEGRSLRVHLEWRWLS